MRRQHDTKLIVVYKDGELHALRRAATQHFTDGKPCWCSPSEVEHACGVIIVHQDVRLVH